MDYLQPMYPTIKFLEVKMIYNDCLWVQNGTILTPQDVIFVEKHKEKHMLLKFDKSETWPKSDLSSVTNTYFGKCKCHGKWNPIWHHFGTHLGTGMGTKKKSKTAIQKEWPLRQGRWISMQIWVHLGCLFGHQK